MTPTWQNFQNKRAYNSWCAWPFSKILRNHYLYSSSKRIFQKSVFFLIILDVLPTLRQTQWNLFLSHAISAKDTQEPFIYERVALSKPCSNFPEICHFADNSARCSDIASNFMNLPRYIKLFQNFWITWPVFKIRKNLYLCTFSIDWIQEQVSGNSSFCR